MLKIPRWRTRMRALTSQVWRELMSKVHFFPPSLPDETIESRVSRYHCLSGNILEKETFRDLFGSAPFSLARIVERLGDLADKLPGDRGVNISELLETNTIYPIYRPFLGLYKRGFDSSQLRSREPYIARICYSCSQEDVEKHGCYYWHRAHQLPGVMVCWRHGEFLRYCCPSCCLPFFRFNRLLANPMSKCICGRNPLQIVDTNLAPTAEREYAEFARSMLHSNFPFVAQEALSACYQRQAREMGYMSSVYYKNAEIGEGIKKIYSMDSIARIDNKYANTNSQAWIRLAQSTMDMPIPRHILIIKYLFVTAEEFETRLSEEIVRSSLPKAFFHALEETEGSLRKVCRRKLNAIISTCPNADIEFLLKHSYSATRWVIKNDRLWLDGKLSLKSPRATHKTDIDPRDEGYAELIRLRVGDLYTISGTAARVSINNALKLLPQKIYINTDSKKARFPLVMQQLLIQVESVWHLRLRRVIWALVEISRLKVNPSGTHLRAFSKLAPIFFRPIIIYFGWDLKEMVSNPIDGATLLNSTGVTRQWLGPFESDASIMASPNLTARTD